MLGKLIHGQMWRTAAVYLVLVLSHTVGEGSVVKVLCQLDQRVSLICSLHHEDMALVPQLSVQWTSPHNQLLCHYIKHKAFQNCTDGYTIIDAPGSITLTIRQVKREDFGVHVCSLSKRHKFFDYSIELVRVSETVTSAPTSGWRCSGPLRRLILLHILILLIFT